MNTGLLNQIVNAVLYEGYILYPYRSSSIKNTGERFTFGRVHPKAYSAFQKGAEPCLVQTECLQRCRGNNSSVEVSIRFLHPLAREVGVLLSRWKEPSQGATPSYRVVPELEIGGKIHQTWQEAVEREVKLAPIQLKAGCCNTVIEPFMFPGSQRLEPITDEAGKTLAVIARRQEALEGVLEVKVKSVADDCFKLVVHILNLTPLSIADLASPESVMMRTFASTHTILHAKGGEFVSLIDPPADLKQLAADCRNIGTWPVLVGDDKRRPCDTMLSSPIILYDYPEIAPESGGDFCDGTEIDEMLALRVMTMTDGEKHRMTSVDAFARKILERTQKMTPNQLSRLHGALRDFKEVERGPETNRRVESAIANGISVKIGDRVKIRPNCRADAFDLVLAGKTGIIEALEQDAEDKIHLAIVLEDDPGKDLGMMRQPGHRFFYGLDEIEPLKEVVT